MKELELNTWEDLENEVGRLYRFLKSRRKRISCFGTISTPLFRGQRSSSWNLSTTLERYLDHVVSVEGYNHHLLCIKPAIEAYTGTKWELENPTLDNTLLSSPLRKEPMVYNHRAFDSLPNQHFMAYVRHHGFPSPLLDWSESPYIALFFAFHMASGRERVALYVYVEVLGEGKGGPLNGPRIIGVGPFLSTHKRHFMQQGQYTVAIERLDGGWVYCAHDKFFSAPLCDDQDYLLKLTLPGEIKDEVLNRLQSMNINAFTLFNDEDSLMDMLAYRELLKKRL